MNRRGFFGRLLGGAAVAAKPDLLRLPVARPELIFNKMPKYLQKVVNDGRASKIGQSITVRKPQRFIVNDGGVL